VGLKIVLGSQFSVLRTVLVQPSFLLRTGHWEPRTAFFSFLTALAFRPAFLHRLARPAQGKRISRNVFRDTGSGRDVRPSPEAHRRHKSGVAADEYAILNHGLVLVDAIIVAGNRPGAHIHA